MKSVTSLTMFSNGRPALPPPPPNILTCHCYIFFDILYNKLYGEGGKTDTQDSVKRRRSTALQEIR